jgi:replicative DNA helicase
LSLANTSNPLAAAVVLEEAQQRYIVVRTEQFSAKIEKGLDLLVVDYQLMQAGGRYKNRNLEIGAITRGLKGLAKEFAIPVIALQLSGQPDQRGSDHRSSRISASASGAR